MSTLVVSNVKSTTAAPVVLQNTSGTTVGRSCRGWVQWNGTGTVAIRDDFNVSSITDHGTGEYEIIWDDDMPNINYCLVGNAKEDYAGDYRGQMLFAGRRLGAYTAGGAKVDTMNSETGDVFDCIEVHAAAFST